MGGTADIALKSKLSALAEVEECTYVMLCNVMMEGAGLIGKNPAIT